MRHHCTTSHTSPTISEFIYCTTDYKPAINTTAKMFSQTYTAHRPLKLTLTFRIAQARDQTSLLCEFITNQLSDSPDIRQKPRFCLWWPWALSFKLVQSKGPNTSSLWISCKSIQQFPEIFHTQTKKVTDSVTKNRILRSSLCAVTKKVLLEFCFNTV